MSVYREVTKAVEAAIAEAIKKAQLARMSPEVEEVAPGRFEVALGVLNQDATEFLVYGERVTVNRIEPESMFCITVHRGSCRASGVVTDQEFADSRMPPEAVLGAVIAEIDASLGAELSRSLGELLQAHEDAVASARTVLMFGEVHEHDPSNCMCALASRIRELQAATKGNLWARRQTAGGGR